MKQYAPNDYQIHNRLYSLQVTSVPLFKSLQLSLRISVQWLVAVCCSLAALIISPGRMANGWCGPFFSTQQYHSSDLSPFTRLNVRKQDVLRLLSLPGKAGTLIPFPRGARQYGGAYCQPGHPLSQRISALSTTQSHIYTCTHTHAHT